MTRLDADGTYLIGVLPALVVIGVGVGVAVIPFNMIILTTAPPEHAGVTAGLLQTALTVGGSLGRAALLIPFTEGGGIAESISSVFAWARAEMALALVVALLFWFGPGARGAEPAGRG
ncbi:hypothetical protein [Streptosporangium sp. 'caverna']|uniref:hypothetical protein n=1 Tax=Streptosporangium sp. 'caverna' TaxID=2202249 RepID=UPI0019550703|nr:hypothetical protein [Streptosporangium sp. 'caverna']